MKEIKVRARRPVGWPLMFEDGRSLKLLHWPCPREPLQRFLPEGLEIGLFEDILWPGLTPFRVTDLHPPGVPAVPLLSNFPETYVRGPGGDRGIWFFALEAANPLAVLGARLPYGLPYRWATMSIDTVADIFEYQSRRRDSSGAFSDPHSFPASNLASLS